MTEHALLYVTPEQLAGAHSIYAPSSAYMWLACAGALLANLNIEDNAGPEAAEGTVAHSMGEQWLKTGERPTNAVGSVELVEERNETFTIEITDEMLDFVELYVDWCNEVPGKAFVEQRVYFSHLTPLPRQGGTADHFVFDDQTLTITDLKYGKGIKVYAKNNPQAMLYALGVIYEYGLDWNFDKVVIRICQPRLDHFDTWETNVEDLLVFAKYVRVRAFDAWAPNAPRTPSEKACQWCRVTATCPAYAAFLDQIVDGCFEYDTFDSVQMATTIGKIDRDVFAPQLADPQSLSVEQMAKLLPMQGAVEKWFSAIAMRLTTLAANDVPVPGYKTVEGRSIRKWRDEKTAARVMLSAGVDVLDMYKVDFIGPTRAEELLRPLGYKPKAAKDLLSGAIIKPLGKPTLVREDDHRPESVDLADDSFDYDSPL